jgi:signal transduction histidine kinase
VGSATDIDEQRRAYAELADARTRLKSHADELEARVRVRTATLREANAELEAFTYSVSHDLRTPLQFVRGFAEAIRSDAADNLSPENRDYLHRIIRAASRMDTIIQDLLGYSRLARAEMQLIELPLDEMINDVLAHHHAVIRESGAHVQVARPLPVVLADKTGLFQALSNLVSNALKFTRPGDPPEIRIRCETTEAGTRLWVEDGGIGIDPRHHERIFKLFERLHSPAEYPGTGIGLSLVRKAVMRMGGQCGVESQPNQGSRFWIEFPQACAVAPAVSHAL